MDGSIPNTRRYTVSSAGKWRVKIAACWDFRGLEFWGSGIAPDDDDAAARGGRALGERSEGMRPGESAGAD